jgi:dUTP pyrophosphatase
MVLEGIIDPGYTGKLSAIVFNPTFLPKFVKKGDRLIQLLIIPIVHTNFQVVNEMPKTRRGRFGFGSTDVGLNANKVGKLQW